MKKPGLGHGDQHHKDGLQEHIGEVLLGLVEGNLGLTDGVSVKEGKPILELTRPGGSIQEVNRWSYFEAV